VGGVVKNSGRIEAMREAAMKKARSLAWADYRRRIVEVVATAFM
jgi:hypothetical protein